MWVHCTCKDSRGNFIQCDGWGDTVVGPSISGESLDSGLNTMWISGNLIECGGARGWESLKETSGGGGSGYTELTRFLQETGPSGSTYLGMVEARTWIDARRG